MTRRRSPLGEAMWCEWLKLRRSAVLPVSLGVAFLIPGVVGLFMKVLVDPVWAERFGLVTLKAQATGTTADWSGYLSILTQAVAVGGLIVFGLVEIWVFGREFADRTAKDLLALPVRRSTVVVAKFAVAAGWCTVLAAVVLSVGTGAGALIDIPGWGSDVLLDASRRYVSVAGLTLALATSFGFAAGVGRGYLPAVGALFGSLFVGQILAALGFGNWFPWSVPALMSGVAGGAGSEIGPIGPLLVLLTGVGAVTGAIVWWNAADHT